MGLEGRENSNGVDNEAERRGSGGGEEIERL